MKSFLSFVILLFSVSADALETIVDRGEAGVIRVCQTEKAKYAFRIDLANLILAKTARVYGKSEIVPFRREEQSISQNRCIELLKSKRLDLLYLPPKGSLLSNFSYIPFDIHAGMLGYRVFLIRKHNAADFKEVKNLADLRAYTGGFGKQWGDFNVFALNKLPVEGAANSSVLMKMLRHNRFDYFHRGLHEAWAELEASPEFARDLMVEERLALRYPFQVFFWFHKDNKYLKQRFETGLLLTLQDGSYRTLFNEHFGSLVEKAKLHQRTIIDIDYPMLDEVKQWLGDKAIEPFWLNTSITSPETPEPTGTESER